MASRSSCTSTETQGAVTIVIVTGVSGAGKTTVGKQLAADLGWRFEEGDDFHPQANIDKMSAGQPLSDEDRQVWIERLRARVEELLRRRTPAVISCSALKQAYRDRLRVDRQAIGMVYLAGGYDMVRARLEARRNHFMPASLLASQFEALQEPADALRIDASLAPQVIVEIIERSFDLKAG